MWICFFYRTCGSTVGPMLSKTGIRTVDVGCAMLSMHSIRETAGSHDLQHAIDLFSSFFEHFVEVDRSLTLDWYVVQLNLCSGISRRKQLIQQSKSSIWLWCRCFPKMNFNAVRARFSLRAVVFEHPRSIHLENGGRTGRNCASFIILM